MELRDLTHDERLALVGLLDVVVESDRDASEGEISEIDRVIGELGLEEFRALGDEVELRFPTEDDLRKFLPSIGRQEARELIYGTVLQTALESAFDVKESELLDWLAKVWNVPVCVEEPAGS